MGFVLSKLMASSKIEELVETHYTRGNLTNKILAALDLGAAAPGTVPVESLHPVDQLHHGGIGLTRNMARAAGLTSAQVVLDAGSGIGGSARHLADQFGCTVYATDLSREFIETAKALDALVGLTGKIEHRAGSVLDLPYDDATFDVVWCQNVTMNVADKPTMFAEAYRVLKPGGVYVISHFGEGNGETIDFPLPWAMTAETSFTTRPDEMMKHLSDAGFDSVISHDSAPAPPPPSKDGQPDDSVAMGADMGLRRQNSSAAVADGRLVPVILTAKKP